ncbi:hypothetical protein [Nocardia callitridis]|uniref:Secreted protein n=1 Tax=Nocardia callitridis TaxID=648753 RepID=A0ABP9KPP9_9NOCA
MQLFRMLFGAVAMVVAAVSVVATAGVASADVGVEIATGRHWLVVTVTPLEGDDLASCRVDPFFGTPETVSWEVPATGNLFVDGLPAGPRKVSIWCPNGVSTQDVVVGG